MQRSKGLFSIDDLNQNTIQAVFSLAREYKKNFKQTGLFSERKAFEHKLVAHVFLEPSTRTRFSFEMATERLGARSISFTADSTTSLVKGESARDTLLNLQAMQPDLMVIRSGEDESIKDFFNSSNQSCLNAGFGRFFHPTQALLDAFTLQEHFSDLESKKLVMVGDVEHSRVANSNLKLLTKLGVEVFVCAPTPFLPTGSRWEAVTKVDSLAEALSACDVVMSLRTQKERHAGSHDSNTLMLPFQLNENSLKHLSPQGRIMHPGPFNEGEELTSAVLGDKRCVIYDQVENGVYIRAALMKMCFEGEL